MSVWESKEALREFVYKSDHASILLTARRIGSCPWTGRYLPSGGKPAGTIPTILESRHRLDRLASRQARPWTPLLSGISLTHLLRKGDGQCLMNCRSFRESGPAWQRICGTSAYSSSADLQGPGSGDDVQAPVPDYMTCISIAAFCTCSAAPCISPPRKSTIPELLKWWNWKDTWRQRSLDVPVKLDELARETQH